MSDTPVDMPKVCQMLDNGWTVQVYKNEMGSYTAAALPKSLREVIEQEEIWADDEDIPEPNENHITDDFTPEQAMTRLAYKILGEII